VLYFAKKNSFLVWLKACCRQAGVASHIFQKVLELIQFKKEKILEEIMKGVKFLGM
jgi:hypothetical protein